MTPSITPPIDLAALADHCSIVGKRVEWVQGPGGNASLKSDDVLWVKASGTWLAHAADRPIFVPVRLSVVRRSIAARAQGAIEALPGHPLRPSIETTLHALMPHRFVLHIHSVRALTFAVLADGQTRIARQLDGQLPWRWVPYARPGTPLTEAVREATAGTPSDYLVLANHGVVLGADTLADLEALLRQTEDLLAPASDLRCATRAPSLGDLGVDPDAWRLPTDERVHALATGLLNAAQRGPLYPDHTVFLGAATPSVAPGAAASYVASHAASFGKPPNYLIVPDHGVCVARDATETIDAMLLCWALVLSGLPGGAEVRPLTEADNAQLLNWDAEKYRQALEGARR